MSPVRLAGVENPGMDSEAIEGRESLLADMDCPRCGIPHKQLSIVCPSPRRRPRKKDGVSQWVVADPSRVRSLDVVHITKRAELGR